jgi:hypothetical protein
MTLLYAALGAEASWLTRTRSLPMGSARSQRAYSLAVADSKTRT